MLSLMEYVRGTLMTSEFATSECPIVVFLGHLLVYSYAARKDIDVARPGRHPFQSLLLTLLYVLGGGTLTALFIGKRPGWAVSEAILPAYLVFWAVMRVPVLRGLCSALLLPSALLHNFIRAHVLVTTTFAAAQELKGCMVGTILMPVITSQGGLWMTQLILKATQDQPMAVGNDFERPTHGLKATFWISCLYCLATNITGTMPWMPIVSVATANLAVVALYQLDGLVHGICKSDFNFWAPIEWPIYAIVQCCQGRDNNNKVTKGTPSPSPKKDN